MQQFISSVEAQALLDRILQTSQSLNRAIAELAAPVVEKSALPTTPPLSPVIEAKVEALPPKTRPVTPVLTIKLADLVRASEDARRRRQSQHQPPPKHQPRPIPLRRHGKEVEVVVRRSFRMVS